MDYDPTNPDFVSLAEKAKVFKSIEDILNVDSFVSNEQVEETRDGKPIFGQVVDLEASKDGPLYNRGFSRVVIVRAEPHLKRGIDTPEQTFVAAYGQLGDEARVYQFVIDIDEDSYPDIKTRQDDETFNSDTNGERPSISRKDANILKGILDATKSEIGIHDFDIQDFVSNETMEFERLKVESSKKLRDLVLRARNAEPQDPTEHADSSEDTTVSLILPVIGTEEGLLSVGINDVNITYTSPSSRYPYDTFIINVNTINGDQVLYEHTISPDGRNSIWREVAEDTQETKESFEEMKKLLKLGYDDLAAIAEGAYEAGYSDLDYDKMSELENVINLARFDAGLELPQQDDVD